jgi:hypothetical protein
MKEKEKNIYGIHQYTLTRRRKVRGKKRNIKRKPNKEERKREKRKQKTRGPQLSHRYLARQRGLRTLGPIARRFLLGKSAPLPGHKPSLPALTSVEAEPRKWQSARPASSLGRSAAHYFSENVQMACDLPGQGEELFNDERALADSPSLFLYIPGLIGSD